MIEYIIWISLLTKKTKRSLSVVLSPSAEGSYQVNVNTKFRLSEIPTILILHTNSYFC